MLGVSFRPLPESTPVSAGGRCGGDGAAAKMSRNAPGNTCSTLAILEACDFGQDAGQPGDQRIKPRSPAFPARGGCIAPSARFLEIRCHPADRGSCQFHFKIIRLEVRKRTVSKLKFWGGSKKLLNRINTIRGSGLSRSAYKRLIRPDPPSHGCDILEQFQRPRLAGVGPGRHFDRGFRLLASRA